jgi:hypothetical protein
VAGQHCQVCIDIRFHGCTEASPSDI